MGSSKDYAYDSWEELEKESKRKKAIYEKDPLVSIRKSELDKLKEQTKFFSKD